jgi:hypothetical protein
MAKSAANDRTAPRLRVRYYRRMRINRVYPVKVSWATAARGATAGPVTVRLVMAGAQVVPLEQTLDPSRSDAKVTFHVTPIAKGWLGSERVEVVTEGRKVDEVRLPAKVTSQRFTWLLLFLTFFIPFWVVPLFTAPPESFTQPMFGNPIRKSDPDRMPGFAITQNIRNWAPTVPDVVEENFPDAAEALYDFPGYLGKSYNNVYWAHQQTPLPLGYYSFLGLLVLTLLSFWWHNTARKTRKSGALTALLRTNTSD